MYARERANFAEMLKQMAELETRNLQDTFSMIPSPAADDPDNHMRDHLASVAKILATVGNELAEFNATSIAMLRDYSHSNYSNGKYYENLFLKKCEPHGLKFSAPRRSLETLATNNQFYTPIRPADYTPYDKFVLQDLANGYIAEVRRQFKKLAEAEGDGREFIEIFNKIVEQFLDAQMTKFQNTAENVSADALRKFVDDVNKFASRVFAFYRAVRAIVGPQQPTTDSHQLELRYELYFELGIGVLKKKTDQKLPFALFGSEKVTDLAATIGMNKAILLRQARGGQGDTNDSPAIAAYHTVFNQILFAVGPILDNIQLVCEFSHPKFVRRSVTLIGPIP